HRGAHGGKSGGGVQRRAPPPLTCLALVLYNSPVSSTAAPPLDEATIFRILQASKAEEAAGRPRESDQLLAGIAQRAPNHPAVLNELGVRMMARGSPDQAQA